MRKTTQKELRSMAREGFAHDITGFDFDQANELHKAHALKIVAISRGVYGMNGALLEDENGERYVITARNSTLFQLV